MRINRKKIINCIAITLSILTITLFSQYFFIKKDRLKISTVNNTSSGFIVMESLSGRIIQGQNIHTRLEMASTTKIMTALVVLENLSLDKEIVVPKEGVGIEGSSIYLKEGEKWTVRDLLYGLMLRSGNDSATTLAISCAGSEEKFVEKMNQFVHNMGLKDTHFTNPHGLHNDEHYTSAYDLAKITAYAYKNEDFEKIVSSKSYVVAENDTHPSYTFVNKNKMLNLCDGCNGVKTGFTKASGRCLVSGVKRNNLQLICVAINHYDMWNDSIGAMNQAFSQYSNVKIGEKDTLLVDKMLGNSPIKIALEDDIYYPIKKGDNFSLSYQFDIDKNIQVPIKKGEIIGNIDVYDNNHLLFSSKIITMEEINNLGVALSLSNLVGNWHIEEDEGKIKQIFSYVWSSV